MTTKAQGRRSALEWTALIIVAPLLIGGVLAMASRQRWPIASGPRGLRPRRSRATLRGLIVGKSKNALASLLGIPHTATVKQTIPPAPDSELPIYFQAQTWYYPLDARDRSGMAIQFTGDIAREVEFFGLA